MTKCPFTKAFALVGLSFVAALAALGTSACARTRRPVTDPADGATARDGGSRPLDSGLRADAGPPAPCSAASAVDVLFMVDNSNSMAEEQASLTGQFRRFVGGLTDGDPDADGIADFLPIRDLHLGVVTSDMGNGGFAVPTCSTTFGDDGILITRGNTRITGCAATYPPYLVYMPSGDASGMRLAADLGCVASVGTGGCGFEQQLESVLKALTPSSSSIAFGMGTAGHGDAENAGFVRPDSLLALVLVTDEEDCSAADPDIINPTSTTYTGELNLRCFTYPEAVHPVSRYVDGLRALRSARPDLFVFGVIAGVPTDLVADPARVDYGAILGDSRMQEQIDTAAPTRLLPSCNVPGRGLAFPPRRIVEVAQQLGAQAVVQSICQENFGPAIDAIALRIGAQACAAR